MAALIISGRFNYQSSRANATNLIKGIRELYQGVAVPTINNQVIEQYKIKMTSKNSFLIATKPDDSKIIESLHTLKIYDLQEPNIYNEFAKMCPIDTAILATYRLAFLTRIVEDENFKKPFLDLACCYMTFKLGNQYVEQATYTHFDNPTDTHPSALIRIYTILEKAANAQPYIRDCNFNILLELTEELRKLYKESIRETLNFTPRELEIAKFGLQNLTRGKISDNLFLSKHTVTTHTKHITSKAKLFNSELKNFNEVGYYLEKIGLF